MPQGWKGLSISRKLLIQFIRGIVERTLQVLDELQSENKQINRKLKFYEFMFFVTAIDVPNYGITVSECYDLIKSIAHFQVHEGYLIK